jgi:hypothetical protein
MSSILRAFCASVFIPAALTAADLTLRDGRTLRDYRILSQSPSTVTVRHAAGLAKVDKAQLPDELAAQYPVDPAAVVAEQQANECARAEHAAQVAAAREAKRVQYEAEQQARAERRAAFAAKVAAHNAEVEAGSRPITQADRRADELAAYRTPNGCRTYVEQQGREYFRTTRYADKKKPGIRSVSVTMQPAHTVSESQFVYYGRAAILYDYGWCSSKWERSVRCTATLPAGGGAPVLAWEVDVQSPRE